VTSEASVAESRKLLEDFYSRTGRKTYNRVLQNGFEGCEPPGSKKELLVDDAIEDFS
jgi:hypothetical protein